LQAITLEKREKTAKYFTPPMGGGPPGALTPYQRGKEKGELGESLILNALPLRFPFPTT
tara:strand:+ start:38 stop:214 length:177 start_codon:yes stop_codon:yes gene_type:complete